MSAFSEAHRRHVCQLYRQALKTTLDWYIMRPHWRQKALEIRLQFDMNKHLTNPAEVQRLVKYAEDELQAVAHPDPYKCTCKVQCLIMLHINAS
jgi:NADH dehydrogenase (ubiquinone) 1 beta subcomplex subunit 9